MAKIPRTPAGTRTAPVVPLNKEAPVSKPTAPTGIDPGIGGVEFTTEPEHRDDEHARDVEPQNVEYDEAVKLIRRAAGPLNELLVAVAGTLILKPGDTGPVMNYANAIRKLASVVREKPSE